MAWETRKRGGTYYTRSRREGGRVVREYVGAGAVAALCAELDEERRDEREWKREADRRDRKRLDDLDREAAEYCAAVDRVLADALTAAGYHRHERGEWRKRRHGNTEEGNATGQAGG